MTSRASTARVAASRRMIAVHIAAMFFMSIAPRPHRQPSCSSPENGGLPPLRGVGFDHVEVRGEQQRRLAAGPAVPHDQVGPAGRELEQLGLVADLGQRRGEVVGADPLVARRVGRVHAQQRLAEPASFLAERAQSWRGDRQHHAHDSTRAPVLPSNTAVHKQMCRRCCRATPAVHKTKHAGAALRGRSVAPRRRKTAGPIDPGTAGHRPARATGWLHPAASRTASSEAERAGAHDVALAAGAILAVRRPGSAIGRFATSQRAWCRP